MRCFLSSVQFASVKHLSAPLVTTWESNPNADEPHHGRASIAQVFRQKEQAFVDILNAVRVGNGADAIRQLVAACRRPLGECNGIQPTQLFGKNADVDRVNNEALGRLPGAPAGHDIVDCVIAGISLAAISFPGQQRGVGPPAGCVPPSLSSI